MIKSRPSLNVTECSLLALVISTVPNFCDIIRMTVFPPRASFQRTYHVATTALMSWGSGSIQHHADLASAQQLLCAGSGGGFSLSVHIQSFLTQELVSVPFSYFQITWPTTTKTSLSERILLKGSSWSTC